MILEENNAQEAVIDSLVDECIQEGREEGKQEERQTMLENLKVFFSKKGFEDNFQAAMYDEFVAFLP